MAAVTAKVPGAGSNSLAFSIPLVGLDVESVLAEIDTSGAAGAVTAELVVTDQSGVVIARVTQATTIPAGGSGSATWALGLAEEGAAKGGYSTIQDEGVPLPQETIIDFVGDGVTATDDAANARTKVTIPGSTVVAGTFITSIFGILPNLETTPGSGIAYAARLVVPVTGTLHDLTVFMSIPSGNLLVGIYDTSATTRNLLYQSASISAGVISEAWKVIGDPALAVSKGDNIDLVVKCDNNTIELGFLSLPANGMAGPLPTGFLVTPGGGKPIMGWEVSGLGTGALPSTLAEASLVPWRNIPLIIARVA